MGMEDYPRNLSEFRDRFTTEEACIAYLTALRWPDGFKCPKCSGSSGWKMSRGLFLCQECRHQISVTSGTIFHQTRKPLRVWFEAMWHVTNQKYGANALGLQRILGLGSYHTAWQWLHRLRRAMVRPERERLMGPVEVDETYIGGERPGKRGRGADNKMLVAVAVEDDSVLTEKTKGIGRIRLSRIPNASADSLLSFLAENVASGSQVRTDGWLGYEPIIADGYEHVVVESRKLVITHLTISLLKRWLLGTYQGAVQAQQLDYYLDEFTFRFNRRKSTSRGKLFYRLVQQSVTVDPVPAREIVGGSLRKPL
jgi:transposase-like protein